MALAQWKAEELNAHLQGRTVHETAAPMGFEAYPMRWPAWSRTRHATVWAVWSWVDSSSPDRGSKRRYKLTSALMSNLLDPSRPGVPVPSEFSELHLLEMLRLAARREVEATKSPCEYLGVQIGDRFEADPGKWPADVLPEGPSEEEILNKLKQIENEVGL